MPRDAADIVTDSSVGERSDGVAFYCAACGPYMSHASMSLRMGCGAHMGWMYEGMPPPPAVFFGLIKPMLVERPG